MIDLFDYAIDKVGEHITGPRTRFPTKFWFRCVFCGDSQKKLTERRGWLVKDKECGVHFHCYNCGRHYNGYTFLMELEGKTYKEVRSDLFSIYKDMGFDKAIKNIMSGDNILIQNTNDESEAPPEKKTQTFDLKSTWQDLTLHAKVNKLMEKRCIYNAPNLPKRFKLYYDTKFEKIVIPWYRQNKLRYFQYRVIGNSDGPKYQFPKDTEKDIFGLDSIDPDFPYIFFCEGAFDAIWVKNGIAVGGATLTDHQREILEFYMQTHTLIFFPDNPFLDKRGKEEILKLCKQDKTQKIFLWDKRNKFKDINDEMKSSRDFNKYMDEDFLTKSITSAMKYQIMLKFSGN